MSRRALAAHLVLGVLFSQSGCTYLFGDARGPTAPLGETCGQSLCNVPPKSHCVDTTTLRTYAPAGTCRDLLCTYAEYSVLCTEGCAADACVGNEPCSGIICDQPPARACLDGDTLHSYSPTGTCSAGVCSYGEIDTVCADGCAQDACTGDLCAGITCSQPPAPTCLDASTRRGYASVGSCSDGLCAYASADTSCTGGCAGGVCIGNPCAGITCNQPPAALCANPTTRRSYAASGTCNGGTCSYTATDTSCTAPTHGTPTCAGGTCDFSCASGYMKSGASCVPVSLPNTWSAAADMTARQALAAATGADGRIFAIGGEGGLQQLSKVEAYTPSTNTWATVAPMPTARDHLAAARGADGRIYAIGGRTVAGNNSTIFHATVEAYTPSSNSWATVASMPTARLGLAAAVGADGRIYAIGGNSASTVNLTTVEVYTPSSDSWATVASLNTARNSLAAATGADGRIYAIGGSGAGGAQAAMEVYDPGNDSWTPVASLPTARFGLAAATGSDGRIYALGGYLSGVLATTEVYDPGTNSWATKAAMPTARYLLAGATGLDGRIYTLGGQKPGSVVPAVEVYTP